MEAEKSKVIVVPCSTYQEETVYAAVKKGLELLGGISEFVSPEEKILVKPNFLTAAEADRAVTTHPAVIRAVLRILSENGCLHVKYGDSPGHGSSAAAAKKLGLTPENTFGAEAATMNREKHVPFPQGMTAKEFYFTEEIAEADAIISLCKMKTHALEQVTGAVKNVYGFVCGAQKAAGHVKYPNASIFARMLADIHRCTRPRLHIMDGIMAMEGNGPGSGTPTPMNVLLFSTDPVALDTAFCYLVCLDPEAVPTNTQGQAMGIGTFDEKKIEVLLAGEETEHMDLKSLQKRLGNPGFDVDRKSLQKTLFSRYSDVMRSLSRRPVIQKEKCVKCGICVQHCPVPGKAIDFKNGKKNAPVYDYTKCIRCYCCQEMCPQHAITVGGNKFETVKGKVQSIFKRQKRNG